MIKKILAAIGILGATITSTPAQSAGGPYADNTTNLIYELLFCDSLNLYKENHKGNLEPPWSALFSTNPDFKEIAKIASDKSQESRVRMLAYNLLRSADNMVPKKKLLGTIIEVHLSEGLDTLAVFADGSARYINFSEKIAVVEGIPNEFEEDIRQIIEASKPIVAAIGPWDKERLLAPRTGNIRMTFLVSDGLYFGEGPMTAMQKDQMAEPLINAATSLLVKLVERTADSESGSRGDLSPSPHTTLHADPHRAVPKDVLK